MQLKRYRHLNREYKNRFGLNAPDFFSSPGRIEIAGNHTDHNNGIALAAAVDLDSIAAAVPVSEPVVSVFSYEYSRVFKVSLENLVPLPSEKGTTSALIRGIASRLHSSGYKIGGFNACLTSNISPGSGLSSSASIEILICTIFNYLYNHGRIPLLELAESAQHAENVFFGKPCGLMDQIACASGGINKIDFKDPIKAKIRKLRIDFNQSGYSWLIVNTGQDHTQHTEDYARIPEEMKSVAAWFNKQVCRELKKEQVLREIPVLRKHTGDRAILRALHFFNENKRVNSLVQALDSDNYEYFIELMNQSGDSSSHLLQNIYNQKHHRMQGVSLAITLTQEYFYSRKINGACRVHGGGFGGTILALLPLHKVHDYKKYMSRVFGEKAVYVVNIRTKGSVFLGKLIFN